MKLPKRRRRVVAVEAPRRTRRMGGGGGGGPPGSMSGHGGHGGGGGRHGGGDGPQGGNRRMNAIKHQNRQGWIVHTLKMHTESFKSNPSILIGPAEESAQFSDVSFALHCLWFKGTLCFYFIINLI